MRIPSYICLLGALTGWLGIASCSKSHPLSSQAVPDSTYNARLAFVIQDNFSFSIYSYGLTITNNFNTLSQAGPFTVLVPADVGFQAEPWGVYSYPYLPAYFTPLYLQDFFRYTILPGRFSMDSLPLGHNEIIPAADSFHIYVSKYLQGTDTVVTINGSLVSGTDGIATNGLIQALSSPINPEESHTVIDRIRNDQTLTFFAAAIVRVHADTVLEGPGPWTVLAPQNTDWAALAYLGKGLSTMDSLLAADTAVLGPLVRTQILRGRYFINDLNVESLAGPVTLASLGGQPVSYFQYQPQSWDPAAPAFSVAGGNPAQFPTIYGGPSPADIPAGNGVIHELNQVLIP